MSGVIDRQWKEAPTYPNLINYEKPAVEKGGVIISYTMSIGDDSEIRLANSYDPETKSCALALSEFEMSWAPVYHSFERTQKTGNYKATYEGYEDEYSSIPDIIKVTCTE